jgi:hypothetical protein
LKDVRLFIRFTQLPESELSCQLRRVFKINFLLLFSLIWYHISVHIRGHHPNAMRLFSQSPGSILMFIVLIALSGHYLTHVNALPPSSLLQTGTGLVTKSTVQTFPKSAYVARSVFKRAFGPDDIIYIAVAVCMVLLLAFIGVCICRGHTCVNDA